MNKQQSIGNEIDMLIKKALINRTGVDIVNNPEWPEPKIGDTIQITNWDNQDLVTECIRLNKLPYLTVKEIIIDYTMAGKGFYWCYDIKAEESTENIVFTQWSYKIINPGAQ